MRKMIVDDPLTSKGSTWYNRAADGACTFAADGLHVKANADTAYHACFDQVNVTDFTYEVSFTFSTAVTAGFIFRELDPDPTLDNSYFGEASVYNSGQAVLGASTGGQNDVIGGMHLVFAPLSRHTLAVVAIGSNLRLYVDHKQVASGSDSTYRSGTIGVFTYSTANGDESVFRDARVWVAG